MFNPLQPEEARCSLESIAQPWNFALGKLKLAMDADDGGASVMPT